MKYDKRDGYQGLYSQSSGPLYQADLVVNAEPLGFSGLELSLQDDEDAPEKKNGEGQGKGKGQGKGRGQGGGKKRDQKCKRDPDCPNQGQCDGTGPGQGKGKNPDN